MSPSGPPSSIPFMQPTLQSLTLHGFRNYQDATVAFPTRLALIHGANGAGKTSLLEAVHVLATGRSFRTGRHDKLVGHGRDSTLIRADLQVGGQLHRLGMSRGRRGLEQIKLDGERVRSQAVVAQLFPVMALHPGTVELVEGGSEGRRRLFDWLMFHVEHPFHGAWRDLSQTVRQRNSLLKQGRLSDAESRVWDHQLRVSSGRIDGLRQSWFEAFNEAFRQVLSQLSPELAPVSLELYSGWDQARGLEAALAERLDQDRRRGFTSVGAHRMDLRLGTTGGAVKELFSRGQKKLVAYSLVLGALSVLAGAQAGEKPCVVLVDDLSSELDGDHGRLVLSALSRLPHQVVITSLDPTLPSAGLGLNEDITMFHVEHGVIRPE